MSPPTNVAAPPATQRYELRLAATADASLLIVDRWTGIELVRCCGTTTRYALAQLGRDGAALPQPCYVDKTTVQNLALRITAARLRDADLAAIVPLAEDRLLLSLMRDCAGVHFTAERALLLLDFHGVARSSTSVDRSLQRLAANGCLAEIPVGQRVFYDTNTSPHWHVFVEADAELCDLELTGDEAVDHRVVATLRSTSAEGLHFVRSK